MAKKKKRHATAAAHAIAEREQQERQRGSGVHRWRNTHTERERRVSANKNVCTAIRPVFFPRAVAAAIDRSIDRSIGALRLERRPVGLSTDLSIQPATIPPKPPCRLRDFSDLKLVQGSCETCLAVPRPS